MSDLTLTEVASKYWTPDPALVAYLPRVTCKDCSDKRTQCQRHTKQKCSGCGAYISTAHIHLDYVGHPDVNRTLTEIDPGWSWEPFAIGDDGLPLVSFHDGTAELWGRLTLLGVTRICVGSCDAGKSDRGKELVGDLIRNGAMRHNIYGSLWSKVERDTTQVDEEGEKLATDVQGRQFTALCKAAEMDQKDRREMVRQNTGRTAWKQVTFTEAEKLIELMLADGWELVDTQAGGWTAVPAGSEPFDVSGDASTREGEGGSGGGSRDVPSDASGAGPASAALATSPGAPLRDDAGRPVPPNRGAAK